MFEIINFFFGNVWHFLGLSLYTTLILCIANISVYNWLSIIYQK